jgi:transcriptional regulator with XRE-family HTH domain
MTSRLPEPYPEIAYTLKKLREERGKEQSEIAAILGLDENTVSRYERAYTRIPLGTFCRWLVFLGIPVTLQPLTVELGRSPSVVDLSRMKISKRTEPKRGHHQKRKSKV